jgi:hypothetical protein
MDTEPGAVALIALIDMHDAIVEEITLASSSKAVIRLSRLSLFRRKETVGEIYDVWSHRAQLGIDGISAVEIADYDPSDALIMDGVFEDGDGRELPLTAFLSGGRPCRRVRLEFSTGGRIGIECSLAELRVDSGGKAVEQWVGPLESP